MKARFQIGLAGILILFFLLAAAITYFYERNFYQRQIRDKTDLVMESVEATHGYLGESLQPEMSAELGEDSLVLKAMSASHITRVIMERFNEQMPQFIYRRAAVAARNPDFEAGGIELQMIDYFRHHPGESRWFGISDLQGEQRFVQFRPVVFTEDCLHCHGKADDAPGVIVAEYGAKAGFGKKKGEIAAVQSVSINAADQIAVMRESIFQVFSLIAVVVFCLYIVIWIFFDWTVARNIRLVLGLFRDSIKDEQGEDIFQLPSRGDESKELVRTARRMADHLLQTRNELERYTRRLESMVAEQTRDLRASQEKLQHQVSARNRELHLLNSIAALMTRSMELKDLLAAVLDRALEVVSAQGAGIYLPVRGRRSFRLSQQLRADKLAPELDIELTTQEAVLPCTGCIEQEERAGKGIRVPLSCRGKLQGVLVVTGICLEDLDAAMQELLLSIGRQIGITLESMHFITVLRHNQELLQTVFDAITDPMVMVDAAGRIKMVNAAFLQRHRLTSDRVHGNDLVRLAADCNLPYGSCFPLAEVPAQYEVQLGDGSEFAVISYPVTVQGTDGRGVVCFARDVTGQKEVDRRIHRTERLAALGQLAAGVAHEINNPLGIILCYAEILQREENALGRQQEDIAIIVRQARNCQRIVSDLLNFSRHHDFDGSLVHVEDVIADVRRLLARQLGQQQITFSYQQADNIPPCFMDRARMQQVFVNLLMNSIQAIGDNGEIAVTVAMGGECRLLVQIRDNGCGISSEILPRIFEPFITTKDSGQGTGLGLSVSRGIVEEHGGTLTVVSELGRGTCFTLALPLEGGLVSGRLQ